MASGGDFDKFSSWEFASEKVKGFGESENLWKNRLRG